MGGKNKSMGQVFTPEALVDFMIKMSTLTPKDKAKKILEPSAGNGRFVKHLEGKGYTNITAFEIDEEVTNDCETQFQFEDFLFAEIDQKFKLSIGNPPYIRRKNMDEELQAIMARFVKEYGVVNALSDFSYPFFIRSIELLEEGGELMFVTPSYWLTTVHGKKMRQFMQDHGYMRLIMKFNEASVFGSEASFDAIIFSFIRTDVEGKKQTDVEIINISKGEYSDSILQDIDGGGRISRFSIPQFADAESWAIYDIQSNLGDSGAIGPVVIENAAQGATIGDVVEIGNGLVTGKDKAFRIDDELSLNAKEKKHLMRIMKAKDLKKYNHGSKTAYIWLNDAEIKDEGIVKSDFPNFYAQLSDYRVGGSKIGPKQKGLEERYLYNRDIKWWEWVFLRNRKWMQPNRVKIMCPCKERHDKKGYVRFSLVKGDIMPLQDVTALVPLDGTRESTEYITAWLNSDAVYSWLAAKGHARGGVLEFSEAPLMRIPFKRIDFDNPDEVAIHDEITSLVENYNEKTTHGQIQALIDLSFKTFQNM